jgi:tetratricopeptide (TPR) repeat protein
MRAGRFERAKTEAERVLAPVENSFGAQVVLATLAGRLGNSAETLARLLPGIRAGYVANGNWTYYGSALKDVGRHDEAVMAFCRAARLQRGTRTMDLLVDSYVTRGRWRLMRGDAYGALRDLELAVRLRPEWPVALYQTALVLERLGRFGRALTFSRRARDLVPEDPAVLAALARLERTSGRAP